MKKILLMAGGTATAWHIAKIFKEYYSEVKLYICDINPPYKVHTSILADKYIVVPPIKSENYYNFMLGLLDFEKIDIIIPLIDYDIELFYRDNKDLLCRNIYSSAPPKRTVDLLSNKRNMSIFLNKVGVDTPKCIEPEYLQSHLEYFVKDIVGFGSRNAFKDLGCNLKNISDRQIIQELCFNPEITVDVLCIDKKVYTICREREEVKAGVCTKARIFYDGEIQKIVERVSDNIELPSISCVQFMKNKENKWVLTDFNLRPGGGTALSAAVGFQAVRVAIGNWLDEKQDVDDLLVCKKQDNFVVRAYEEIITR